MHIALTIAGVILLLLLAVLAALLFWPLKYKFACDYGEENRLYVACRTGWLYRCWLDLQAGPPVLHIHTMGLHFQKELPRRSASAKEAAVQPAEEKPPWPERLQDIAEIVHLWTDTRLIREAWLLIKDMVRIANPDRLKISGRFGFDNPEHTGYLLMCSIPLLNRKRGWQFDIEPVWGQEAFEFHVKARGRIRVYALLFRTLRFGLNKKVRRKYDEYKSVMERQRQRREELKEAV